MPDNPPPGRLYPAWSAVASSKKPRKPGGKGGLIYLSGSHQYLLGMSTDEVVFDCEECGDTAEFFVFERLAADDGVGAVESDTPLCWECVANDEPRHLDQAFANYEYNSVS